MSLDALTALHSASHMDGSSLGPMTVLSAAPTLAQGFGGSAGLASGTAGATLKPGGGNGGSSGGYADLFSFITTSYKGGPSKSLGLAGVGARGEEGGGMAPGAPGGTDIAGLLAQLNASQAGSGMGGMTGDVLQALPSLPLMLGRVPGGTGVGVAAGLPPDSLQLLAAALPGGVALSRCDSDDGSGAGISGSGNGEPSLKRQRMSTGATLAAVALPLPVAGATLGVGGVGADFSQMKSLANLSVQDVMRHLNASSGG